MQVAPLQSQITEPTCDHLDGLPFPVTPNLDGDGITHLQLARTFDQPHTGRGLVFVVGTATAQQALSVQVRDDVAGADPRFLRRASGSNAIDQCADAVGLGVGFAVDIHAQPRPAPQQRQGAPILSTSDTELAEGQPAFALALLLRLSGPCKPGYE